VYWDAALPGFGLKVTPKGRKVFIVQYRTRGEGRSRKYTIGPYGAFTLVEAREEAHRVLNAQREGRDLAAEKRAEFGQMCKDLVNDLFDEFIRRHVSRRRSAPESIRIINKEILPYWGGRSVHCITKRDVVVLIDRVIDRGSPIMANRVFAVVRKFFNWCVGRAVIELSPCIGLSPVSVESRRDRVLTDRELHLVIKAAREMGGPFAAIVELLSLTGQRREEVARMTWNEIDFGEGLWTLQGNRTKNGKPHHVQLSDQALAVLRAQPHLGDFVMTTDGISSFKSFNKSKPRLDKLSGVTDWVLHDLRRTTVSGMARLGVPPHVADRILNHTSGTISGVAAIYQRYEFMTERKQALELWGRHVGDLLAAADADNVIPLKIAVNSP
jgi:integrase